MIDVADPNFSSSRGVACQVTRGANQLLEWVMSYQCGVTIKPPTNASGVGDAAQDRLCCRVCMPEPFAFEY